MPLDTRCSPSDLCPGPRRLVFTAAYWASHRCFKLSTSKWVDHLNSRLAPPSWTLVLPPTAKQGPSHRDSLPFSSFLTFYNGTFQISSLLRYNLHTIKCAHFSNVVTSFDWCDLCSHCHNQDTKCFHHPGFPVLSAVTPPLPPHGPGIQWCKANVDLFCFF